MSTKSIYFARAPLAGAGKLHFLIIPQLAPANSAPRTLLGSLVAEYDAGLFGLKEVPGDQHVWKRQYVLNSIAKNPVLSGQTLVETHLMASVTQSVRVEKKFGLGLGGSFPGVPASASIGIDYTKIRSVEISLGAGSVKEYIPTGFLKSGYDYTLENSTQFDRQLFYDDYMAIQQVLIVRQMSLLVESEIDFSANFDASAEAMNNLNVGVKYEKMSKKIYKVSVDDGNDYLFGIGGVQLDRIKG